ncbi:hypothetical protein MJI69_29345, partial [Salmonella enterica subsp. enterica serovar Anatum]|nr:hypothetical protein [Salmonella enterica subsp. enterica serovar Anatum]
MGDSKGNFNDGQRTDVGIAAISRPFKPIFFGTLIINKISCPYRDGLMAIFKHARNAYVMSSENCIYGH